MYRYVAVIFLVLGNHRLHGVHASGNIGCLFSDTLCEQDREWCFDDYAFGRCLPLYGHVKEDDLHRYELGTEELHLLEQEMQRLFLLGYRWSHTYTQCVLQALLDTIRFRKSFDVTSCNGDLDQDLEGALKAIEGEELDHIDPRDLAIVRFTPSETDPHAPYADEVYFPPVEHNDLPQNPQHQHQETSETDPGATSGTGHAGVSGASASPPAQPSAHQDLPQQDSPHQQPQPHNYVNYYGNGADYEDVDVYPYSPHQQYSAPHNPVYRKRSDFTNREISPEQIAKIAAILDDISRNKGSLLLPEEIEAEETVFFPERLLENNEEEEDDEDEGVFGEAPATPMYKEGGLNFVPEIEGENPEESVWSKFSEMRDPWIQVGMPNQDPLMAETKVKEALLPLLSQNEPLPRHFFTEPDDNSINSLLMQEEPSLELENNSDITPFEQMLMQGARVQDSPNLKKLQAVFGPQLNALSDYDTEYEYPDYGLMKGNDYYDYEGNNIDNDPHVFVKKDEESAGDSLDLLTQAAWSFQRPERLDVKKPGPFYENSKNNFAFNYEDPINEEDLEQADEPYVDMQSGGSSGNALLDRLLEERQGNHDFMPQPKIRAQQTFGDVLLTDKGYVDDGVPKEDPIRQAFKQSTHDEKEAAKSAAAKAKVEADKTSTTPAPTPAKPAAAAQTAPTQPPSYVYIITQDSMSETQAKEMVGLILRNAKLPENYVDHLNWEDRQVTFHVKKNPNNVSAADVAKKAEELRDVIKKELDGVEITKAGLGDQSSISAVVFSSGEARILAAAAIVCGVMAALLVAASVLYFLRRHHKTKAKLQGLTTHDTEASKDYQDLCRARMASKAGDGGNGNGVTKGDAPVHIPSQRVSSLSRDSDNGNNSPSSRSSTSSWSEEPVASNMDISTGHMVLSYMEDHLQNKDRLEQEWIALCAYEAEPCATTLALQSENAPKNRYPDCVPYDHNRVVLTAHANVNGSDFMNASSITDHDPRNPAYIATQGPLDTTAADFWQMVWEQGSVVIVMLTRLTENGHAFCYRYWPEEGSELYHIYEVHLVSEHIWCDDYLVRSFYLKNVRTGETRTVTQFHFLSWPDSGIPASTKALLEFRRKVNKSYRGRSCPIIVHCSDGIGRTGTYCLIDMVLNRMAKGAKEIDIAATCEHIRDQRPNMVKSKVQFEFVLMAVAEEVHAILKALPQ